MTSSKPDKIDSIDKIEANFDFIVTKYDLTRESILDETDIKDSINKIICRFATLQNASFDHAFLGMCALFQVGSYLRSVTNRKITVGGIEFTKRNLVIAAEQTKNIYTFRSLARYLKDHIARVSMFYSIPGHLYAKFKIDYPTLISENSQETNKLFSAYCTDFQIENPKTPLKIREFLASRERARMKKQN